MSEKLKMSEKLRNNRTIKNDKYNGLTRNQPRLNNSPTSRLNNSPTSNSTKRLPQYEFQLSSYLKYCNDDALTY